MSRVLRRLGAEPGFTLVELLVVILIIGVLAATGLAAFLGQRTKAQDSEAKVYVTTAAKAMAVWHTDHGDYAGADGAGLVAIEPSLGRALNLTVTSDASTFQVSADSQARASGGGTYSMQLLGTGDVRRDCSHPGSGSCLATADAEGNRW
jgi:type IV pilus assembly protein PilA